MMSDASEIVIRGVGAVSPAGGDVPALWDSLLRGVANRATIADGRFGRELSVGLVPGEEHERLAHERLADLAARAGKEALARGDEIASDVAVVVGTTDAGGAHLASYVEGNSPCDYVPIDWAHSVRERLRLTSEAVTVTTASASGAVAVGVARDLVLSGDVPAALAIGVDTVSDTALAGLLGLRTIGPDGCRPFSAERKGIAVSEGAGALLLRRRQRGDEHAVRLAGYGCTNATTHLAAPQYVGIREALERALEEAALSVDDIDVVNAHGPGTRAGDIAEIEALRTVFGDALRRIPIISSKGVLWHCQGAAGALEAIATVLALERRQLTPTFGYKPVDSLWDDLDFVEDARNADLRAGISISCGLGGVNTALVFAN